MDAKICGVKDTITLDYIINHNHPPRFIGFIANYPKSKRYLEFNQLKKILNVDKKFVENYSKNVPLGRMANKGECIPPILFLLGDGSSYITGSDLYVDGGWTAW